MKFSGMTIGVPKEIMPGEGRVSSTPETVKKMVAEGATVLVQKTAGDGSFFSDDEYVAAGATMVDGAEEVFAKADVILKVKEPLFNKEVNKHESDMLRDGQKAGFLLNLALMGETPDAVLRQQAKVAGVSRELLAKESSRWLRPEEMKIVVVGDAKRLEPELKALKLPVIRTHAALAPTGHTKQ